MLSGLVVDWTAVIVKTSFHRKTAHDTINLAALHQFFFLLPVDLDNLHLISHSFECFRSQFYINSCRYTILIQIQEGTTAERFAEYLKTKLLSTLSEADIIVMDNVRSHHVKAVKQLLDSSKVTYLYLPPYSPDLNPIEKMWSKLKAFLRKEKIRMASELPSAISKGFLTIRPTDCIGWFHSCNYVQ